MAGYSLTDISAALGAYSRERVPEVLSEKIFDGMMGEPEQPLTVFDIMRTRFFRDEQSFARMKLVLQAREKSATIVEQAADAISLDGDLRKLRDIQTVLSFAPYVLENTWLDEDDLYSASPKFKDRPEFEDIEFVPWLVDYMLQDWVSEIIQHTLFGGVYQAGFTYADSFPKAFDGFLKIITDQITATAITNVVPTGVLNAGNTYASLEAMGKAVPYNLKGRELFMLMSEDIHDWYNAGRSAAFPGENASLHPQYKLYKLRDRSRINLIPVPQMAGSQRVFITTRNNLSFNHDFRGDGPQMKFHPKDIENIQVGIDHGAGVSIDMYSEIIANDQA